uniref:Ig-like domain-containing protein n=1 Tax=Cyanoderma ruficeps TaxID=181631 RepID=A0A8C3QVL9_9PASS
GQVPGKGWHCKVQAVLPCQPLPALMTISPAVLTAPEGTKATFFCNISMENDSGSEYSLNWYKETNHSQAQKTAEISRYKPMTETEKYRLTNRTPSFEIEILNLHQNDSGSYYCGLITFFEPDKVMESNRCQLIVTGQPEELKHVKAMLLGILLLAGVAVLLIFGYLTLMYRRGGRTPLEAMQTQFGTWGQPNKEEEPPVVSISTVDYGVLEFQRYQHTPVPPRSWPVEQTEYATIIFPEEKPVTPERGKKHLDERTRQPQPC